MNKLAQAGTLRDFVLMTQWVILWVVALAFGLGVPGLFGMAIEARTAADFATVGLVTSYLFTMAWLLINQAAFDSPNWSLPPFLPLGRDDILRPLIIERLPLLAMPVIMACGIAFATKGLDPVFHAQTLLIGSLLSLLALRDLIGQSVWWGDVVFPYRLVVRTAVRWLNRHLPSGLVSLGILVGSGIGTIVLTNMATQTKWWIPLMGGGQVALHEYGPLAIPAFLVISPFTIPQLATHAATTPGPLVNTITIVGLLGANLLAVWGLVASWRPWSQIVPIQSMAMETLTEELLVGYIEQDVDALIEEEEARPETMLFDSAAVDAGDTPDLAPGENFDASVATPAEQVHARSENEPSPAPALPPPPPRAIANPEALVVVPVLPRLSTFEALGNQFSLMSGEIRSVLWPLWIGMVLLSSGARAIKEAGPEGLRALAALVVLGYFFVRAHLLASSVLQNVPKRSGLPIRWQGMFTYFAFGSLRRDWWHVGPATALLVGLTIPHPMLLLPPLVLIVLASYWLAWVGIRHRSETMFFGETTRNFLLLAGIIGPGFFGLLALIIFGIDYADKLPAIVVAAFGYWAVALFAGYVAILVTAVFVTRRRSDDAVIAPLN